jgi:mRNA interferase MazF
MGPLGMKRGEVWWARMPEPAGRRPVVLVSRDSAYAVRASVTVLEVSTTIRAIASEVALGPRFGLPRKCVANADNIVTIPKRWLEERIAAMRPEKLAEIDAAIRFSLGMS